MRTELTVSELARRTATTADTVRYYERIGILPEARRSAGGYRLFGDDDMSRMTFVRRAQALGLQLDEIRELLEIRDRGRCPCGHARAMLREKLATIDEQMEELSRLRREIAVLVEGDAADSSTRWPCGDGLIQITRRGR